MSNAAVQGQVTDAVSSAPINGAVVDVAENIGWRNTTSGVGAGAGHYSINLSPGNFHLTGSALGYYPTNYYMSVAPNSTPPPQNMNAHARSAPGQSRDRRWLNTPFDH